MKYNFNSKIEELNKFALDVPNEQIKNEPMFFNCDLDFAYAHGKEITRSYIDNLPESWKNSECVIDTRIHMLMPKWYPAIPGYHHDDVPRALDIPVGSHFATAGQPNYDNPEYHSQHIIGLVNADICPTHFALGEVTLAKVENDVVYRVWHEEIVKLLADGKLELKTCQDRTLTYFDCDTFHTGSECLTAGWRWFGRVSRNTKRVKQISNEIRQQVQVYLTHPMQGW